jgi:hypothetical protein
MARPPNQIHSNKILELCDEFNLSDPFRLLNPETMDFTYCPRYANARNRSRIDFFIISENLNNFVRESKISTNLQNKLFDHKAVTVVFNKKGPRKNKRFAISSSGLEDDLLGFLVHATVAETYILHRDRQQGQGNDFLNMLTTCGTIKTLIRDCGPPLELIVGLDIRDGMLEERDRKKNRLAVLTNSIDLHQLEVGPFTCDPLILMETLLMNLKNEVVSYQAFIGKKKGKNCQLAGRNKRPKKKLRRSFGTYS